MPAEKIYTYVRGRPSHSCTESKATTRNLHAAPEEPGNAKALPETGTAVASVKIESSKVATPEEPWSANTPGKPE